MKALRILIAIFLTVPALSAWCAENQGGEVLVVLRTPAGMTLTEESLESGSVRQYIELTAEEVGAKVISIFDSLSLANKDGHIFVFMSSDTKTSEELVSSLKEDPNVVSASPNRKARIMKPAR
ncbi:MAG: hypothetical protein IJQ15_07615 [Synergistaceae bacterium]|nr:hypothetical protein [Synergistaceae bacterium]